MACNSSTCQSGSCRDDDREAAEPLGRQPGSLEGGTNGFDGCQILCLKCKANQPIAGVADDMRFCGDCFRSNLYGKFKHAVSSNAMITPSDKVLVAFSGGPSSRVALEFVHEMQEKAQKNYEANKDRSLPVFGVGVAFIDESAVSSFPSQEMEKVFDDIREIVSNLAPPTKKLHIVPIESIFSPDPEGSKEILKKLLDDVIDTTGKEDLLIHSRMMSLQKVAAENGYTRLLLGTCTSRIACHVISATVKGQGYSLAADIQYVDTRWEVPVVLPLHDCLARELYLLCSLNGSVKVSDLDMSTAFAHCLGSLKVLELNVVPSSGINSLVSSFVKLLQEENPSRECTIVRTAGKLIPFHFNRIPEIKDSTVPLATRRRQKRSNLTANESTSSESFCPICYSPLKGSHLSSISSVKSNQKFDAFGASCCSSCEFQILPKDTASKEHFLSLWPQSMVARARLDSAQNFSLLRDQIQDCLLADSEDEG